MYTCSSSQRPDNDHTAFISLNHYSGNANEGQQSKQLPACQHTAQQQQAAHSALQWPSGTITARAVTGLCVCVCVDVCGSKLLFVVIYHPLDLKGGLTGASPHFPVSPPSNSCGAVEGGGGGTPRCALMSRALICLSALKSVCVFPPFFF